MTGKSVKELELEIKALQDKIAEQRKTEISDAVSKVHAIIAEFNLTQFDIFGGGKAKQQTKKDTVKVAAKYQDGNGNAWSGRGLEPKWLKGKNKEEFLIKH
jgi:DNA-binding protein H-NS